MIYNIPQDLWFRVQDSTADIVYAGYFDNNLSKVLYAIKLGFLKHDCVGRFKIRLHTSTNFNRVYAESSEVDFSEIKERFFTGQVKFDFNGINLNPSYRYYVTIQAVSYTRNADANYVGWLHDRVNTTNVSTGNWDNQYPIRMELFVK